MNSKTGEIFNAKNQKALNELLMRPNMVEIDSKSMTKKQKHDMQVSKFDNKSKLGKVFTAARKQRGNPHRGKGSRSKAWHRRNR